jgi:hypothetical protein
MRKRKRAQNALAGITRHRTKDSSHADLALKEFICPECGKSFIGKPEFDKHRRHGHTMDSFAFKDSDDEDQSQPPWTCTCGRTFASNVGLRQHATAAGHNTFTRARRTAAVYNECEKDFATLADLNRHGERPLVCLRRVSQGLCDSRSLAKTQGECPQVCPRSRFPDGVMCNAISCLWTLGQFIKSGAGFTFSSFAIPLFVGPFKCI